MTADRDRISGRRVLVIEDGPTVTHGDAPYGAGLLAAREYGAAEVIDPRPHAVGSLARILERYDHLEDILPAMGYSDDQVRELEETVRNSDPDVVVSGTPHDLSRVIDVDVPVVRVRYDVKTKDVTFDEILDQNADVLSL
ncbi:MAG: hypothetical protein ACLFR5_00960 [Halobacteriales archaeon]